MHIRPRIALVSLAAVLLVAGCGSSAKTGTHTTTTSIGSGDKITFRDKNNVVRVAVAGGATATPASARRDLARVRGTHVEAAPRFFHVPEGRAVKVVYSTESAPNSVTGKRVTLVVDRYYLRHGGREAVVDLGTPRGVDNVDAYRLMIESFRWR